MLKLYFKNGNGIDNFVADLEKFSEFFNVIEQDIHKRNPNYKIPYYRTWANGDNEIMVDCGSHTEFYVLRSDKNNAKDLWNEHLDGGK